MFRQSGFLNFGLIFRKFLCESIKNLKIGWGIRNFFWREIFWKFFEIFFFAFYSRYQNVRTERLKWRIRKVDITSGCLRIMVYFCNNKWVFILTKVQLFFYYHTRRTFDIWNKMRKKKISKFFHKISRQKKIRIPPIRILVSDKKKNFFSFYSIYQNVRTGQLKWHIWKVDIISGCLTIMVYFCNNEWVFIPTKVQLYCFFVFGNYLE